MLKKPDSILDIFKTFYFILHPKVLAVGFLSTALFLFFNLIFFNLALLFPSSWITYSFLIVLDFYFLSMMQALISRAIEDHFNGNPINLKSILLDHSSEIFTYVFFTFMILVLLILAFTGLSLFIAIPSVGPLLYSVFFPLTFIIVFLILSYSFISYFSFHYVINEIIHGEFGLKNAFLSYYRQIFYHWPTMIIAGVFQGLIFIFYNAILIPLLILSFYALLLLAQYYSYNFQNYGLSPITVLIDQSYLGSYILDCLYFIFGHHWLKAGVDQIVNVSVGFKMASFIMSVSIFIIATIFSTFNLLLIFGSNYIIYKTYKN